MGLRDGIHRSYVMAGPRTGDVLASAELFDPATTSFVPVEDMPLPGEEQAAAPATR